VKLRIIIIPFIFLVIWLIGVAVGSQVQKHNKNKTAVTKTIKSGALYNRMTKNKIN
jgi:hypothetical protein